MKSLNYLATRLKTRKNKESILDMSCWPSKKIVNSIICLEMQTFVKVGSLQRSTLSSAIYLTKERGRRKLILKIPDKTLSIALPHKNLFSDYHN